jgi:hypothetical protein
VDVSSGFDVDSIFEMAIAMEKEPFTAARTWMPAPPEEPGNAKNEGCLLLKKAIAPFSQSVKPAIGSALRQLQGT